VPNNGKTSNSAITYYDGIFRPIVCYIPNTANVQVVRSGTNTGDAMLILTSAAVRQHDNSALTGCITTGCCRRIPW